MNVSILLVWGARAAGKGLVRLGRYLDERAQEKKAATLARRAEYHAQVEKEQRERKGGP